MEKISHIDRTDKKIVTLLEQDARASVSVLARKVRVSRAIAAYRLKKLEKLGVITNYYCFLNPTKINLTVWRLWVSFQEEVTKESFFRQIKQAPEVWWYAECAGTYDAVICLLCRTPQEFDTFFKNLQTDYDNIISSATILIDTAFERHTRGYLLGTQSTVLHESKIKKDTKLSPTALKVLDILSQNCRMKHAELAHRAGHDSKTIASAIKCLLSSGLVLSFTCSVDASKLGYEYYKLLLFLDNPQGSVLSSFREWCRNHPNITGLTHCVGAWQLELDVEIESYRVLCDLIAQMKAHSAYAIVKYEILLVTKEHQASPLAADKFKYP